jgi:sterol desaturase/sphingolipid hydroxylase (fatty acid hydroxylase superfamily)
LQIIFREKAEDFFANYDFQDLKMEHFSCIFAKGNDKRMKFEKIHNKGQAQIFRNQYLEYFTKTNPLVIWGLYLPLIIFLLFYSNEKYSFSPLSIALLFFCGIFFWTFFEYLMHRFVFHWASDNPMIQRISYVMHGNHHEFPRDKQRLFMPPVPSLIIASIVFILMYAVMGINVFAFFPGFMLGYLLYGSMHYAIHAWNPPFKWMKPIWRNHHLHHYKSDEKGFGVSTHIWDKIFGTDFDLKKEKENKEEVQKLMYVKR